MAWRTTRRGERSSGMPEAASNAPLWMFTRGVRLIASVSGPNAEEISHFWIAGWMLHHAISGIDFGRDLAPAPNYITVRGLRAWEDLPPPFRPVYPMTHPHALLPAQREFRRVRFV